MSAGPQIRTALTENLKALHLPAMRDCFEQAARQAEKETLSYEQYLLRNGEQTEMTLRETCWSKWQVEVLPLGSFPSGHQFWSPISTQRRRQERREVRFV